MVILKMFDFLNNIQKPSFKNVFWISFVGVLQKIICCLRKSYTRIFLFFVTDIFTVTYPEMFWGDQFQQGVWEGAVMPPYGSRPKPWWGPGGKAPGNSKDLILWNHLLLIEIYPPQPVMKITQRIFSKILPILEFQVNFSVQSYASLTLDDPAYLQITA